MEWVHQSNGDADALAHALLSLLSTATSGTSGGSASSARCVHACKQAKRERVEHGSGTDTHLGNTLTTAAVVGCIDHSLEQSTGAHTHTHAKLTLRGCKKRTENCSAAFTQEKGRPDGRLTIDRRGAASKCQLPKRPVLPATHTLQWVHTCNR